MSRLRDLQEMSRTSASASGGSSPVHRGTSTGVGGADLRAIATLETALAAEQFLGPVRLSFIQALANSARPKLGADKVRIRKVEQAQRNVLKVEFQVDVPEEHVQSVAQSIADAAAEGCVGRGATRCMRDAGFEVTLKDVSEPVITRSEPESGWGRPGTNQSSRPDTTDTIATSRTGTAEAVKKAREESLAAGIAAREAELAEKKKRTVDLRLKHFRKKFDLFDADGSGAIDREETAQAFKELGIQVDKYKLNKMFDKYDGDGSGSIDFPEFAELITSFNRERYTKVFESFDVDGSGELDAEEVHKAFLQLGFEYTSEFVNGLIKEFDYSGDGLIQLDEFIDMIESTLIVQEEAAEEVVISESPWGETWEMEADIDGALDEETNLWSWVVTSNLRADPDDQEPAERSSHFIPLGWRPTAFLKQDGSSFRGTASSVIVNKGWRQRGVPCRQILWNYNEEQTWEVEYKDPKIGKFEVTTGNNVPQLGEVKFRARTLLGNKWRTLRIPYASQQALTTGDVPVEIIDTADQEPEVSPRGDGAGQGQESEEDVEECNQREDREHVHAELSLENSLSSVDSITEGTELEGESSTESLGLDPNGFLPSTADGLLETQEGEYGDETTGQVGGGNGQAGEHEQLPDGHGTLADEAVGDAPNTGWGIAPTLPTVREEEISDNIGAEGKPDDGGGTHAKVVGGDGTEEPSSPSKSPIKIKVDYGPDGKNSLKYQKMVSTMKDLELKMLRNGSLKLMEERQYALLVRQVNKMDAEAARMDEEARFKAEEDARFKPVGTINWTVRIDELDESAMGMRVGVVHRSLLPGQDWGDYSMANNKAWWWNSYSGNLFVGDVLVPESGNVNNMTTINQWATSRNNPMMGVPWTKGDVLTISLELEHGELTFARNGKPTPHRVCGVWGEVYFAVQMSAVGDRVSLLEPNEDKVFRIERLRTEERERMEIERAKREAKRKEALAALGLV